MSYTRYECQGCVNLSIFLILLFSVTCVNRKYKKVVLDRKKCHKNVMFSI